MHYKSFIFWSITSILKTVSFNFDGKKTICMQFDETMELPQKYGVEHLFDY